MHHFKMTCYGLLGAIIALSGCAPSATTKPDSSASKPAASGPRSTTAPTTGEGQRGGTRESTTDRSSLGQLQEGKSPESTGPLKDIFFDFDSHNLRADARDTLRANADWLKRNPAARVEIEGHCDERGTNEYNLALGAKRAQAAKDYLVTLGVASERLSTISYGEEIPVCKDGNESCWQRNRRDRFVVLPSRPAS